MLLSQVDDDPAASRLNVESTELAILSLAVRELEQRAAALDCLSLAAKCGGVQPGAIFFRQGSV